jgi:SWI/SNF-related matrix-associated actin-dependent regulator 1 of chromatin subfamily A
MITIKMVANYFVALNTTFEQAQFLGTLGFLYSGPKSFGIHARTLHSNGITGHVRFTQDKTVASKLLNTEGVTFTPEALQLVEATLSTIQASKEAEGSFNIPTPKGLTYRPYQQLGVRTIVQNVIANGKGTLIADEMGLGKTMQAIGAIAHLQPTSCLILCLTSIKQNWKRELNKWLPEETNISIATDSTEVLQSGITIVSYPSIVGSSPRAKQLRETLLSHSWPLVVADEAHVLKNDKSQTSKAVLGSFKRGNLETAGIVQNCGHLIVLTGTPIQNKVREALPILRAVGLVGDNAPMTEVSYLFRHCGPKKLSYGTTFDGATNLSELQDKLRASGSFVRRLKVDVAKELPPKVRSIIRFDSIGKEDIELPVGESMNFDAVMNLASRTHSFEALTAYRADLAVAKVPMVIEHLTELLEGSEGKVLVFAHHQTMVTALKEAFPMSIKIDGSTPSDSRQGLIDKFTADPAIRLAILSTRAAGTGLNLQAASQVVFAEADWNPAACVQAEDRAHRIGQESTVTVQYLVIEGTLDARIVQVMSAKMDIADMALDRVIAPTSVPSVPVAQLKLPTSNDNAKAVTVTLTSKGKSATYSITTDQCKAACEALVYLKDCCDGASKKDDVGFNGRDAHSDFVQSLVRTACSGSMSPKQTAWALHILRTYSRTQLAHLSDRMYGNVAVTG